jgi:hypothetical protein
MNKQFNTKEAVCFFEHNLSLEWEQLSIQEFESKINYAN